jgi:hypothetical protein
MRLFGTTALVIAMLLAAEVSLACRGGTFETATLLNVLPADVASEQIVARVEIVEPLTPLVASWKVTNLIRVRVVEAIKGVRQGQTFKVDTGGTDCDQVFPRDFRTLLKTLHNRRPYIAGRFVADRSGKAVFRGAWYMAPTSGDYIRGPRQYGPRH